jgi:hypothetical protein
LIRDLYNGALADLDLGLSPWTMNRYGFAGGNPVSFIELDGHIGGLPEEDLRELRKAGYTYVMGKGRVPLPGGASGGSTQAGPSQAGAERAVEAWMYGPLGRGLGTNDPRYCYMHSAGGVSACQALDAAATAAAGANAILGPLAALSGGADLERCAERHIASCMVAAAGFIPVGKGAKAAELALTAAKEARAANKALMVRKILDDSHDLGKWGEHQLRAFFDFMGESEAVFRVGGRQRRVDLLVGSIAHESKAGGYVTRGKNVTRQIDKDVELLRSGQVQAVVWHFWGTPTRTLLEQLSERGIYSVLHV